MRAATETMPMWSRIYLQRFKRPSEFDYPAIELVLTQELGEWREDLLVETMQWMQGPDQEWGDYPTAKKLSVAYRTYLNFKFKPKTGIYSASNITPRESLFNECKKNMLKLFRDNYENGGVSKCVWQDIWDQICRPDDSGNIDDSVKLEVWAEENLGFSRALTGLAEEMRESFIKMRDAFKERAA